MPEAAFDVRRRAPAVKRPPREERASWYLEQILATAEPIAVSEAGDVFVMVSVSPAVMDDLAAFRAVDEDDEPDTSDEDGHDAEADESDREPSIGWPEDFLAVYECGELDGEMNEVAA